MGIGETQPCGCGNPRTHMFHGVACCEACHAVATRLGSIAEGKVMRALSTYLNTLALAISKGELAFQEHEAKAINTLEGLVGRTRRQ